jgi:hypothetical protein
MPLTFDRLGISFQYPDNWVLDEEDALFGGQSVTVYSPGGAFWSVALHPATTNPAGAAQAAVEALQAEYEEVEVQNAREDRAGHELVGYDLSFFYLDLTNTARVRALNTGTATLTIFYQAEDHEFERVGQVFDAMTTSLLAGLSRRGTRD